ncbi:MAG: trypsin-like peptidase domain-containing protein [Candidatus Omnitrophica bacterium]|nr:trypsin-like peptidase domain-containing protein [Candidatus Omnitrophota bacterium]
MPKPSTIINNFSRRPVLFLPLLMAFSLSISARGDDNLISRIRRTEKSMVTVRTELTRVLPTMPPKMATYWRTAAGLVIDPSGIIVTNTHTIIDAPFIFVILPDGTKLPARVLYANGVFDFSFLKVHAPHPLHRVAWADSSRAHPDEEIIAIGNSGDRRLSMMSGRIKGVLQDRSTSARDFLELDLDLHHGDSGGPILDEQGRLLGMIMAKSESQPDSSIAIASNKIHRQYLQYKKNVP